MLFFLQIVSFWEFHVKHFETFNLDYLQQVDSWNFDMFTFSRAAKGSPLKYLSKFVAISSRFLDIYVLLWFSSRISNLITPGFRDNPPLSQPPFINLSSCRLPPAAAPRLPAQVQDPAQHPGDHARPPGVGVREVGSSLPSLPSYHLRDIALSCEQRGNCGGLLVRGYPG